MVGVAQLVRAPVCGTGGRGFKSLRPPHVLQLYKKVLLKTYKVLCFLS